MTLARRIHQDTADCYLRWLSVGQVTERECRKALAGLGYRPEQIDRMVDAITAQQKEASL